MVLDEREKGEFLSDEEVEDVHLLFISLKPMTINTYCVRLFQPWNSRIPRGGGGCFQVLI